MAIIKNNKDVTLFYIGNKVISAIYRGTTIIWEGVRSCFGSGYWISDKPWTDSDPWTTK